MLKLIMPMAGMGSRFESQGYTVQKPMIPVNDVPMFVHAERCIGLDFDERIFIVRREQNLREDILRWYPGAVVHELDSMTQGTACTLLTAQEHYQDGSSIFVSNCDQHTEWNTQFVKDIIDNPQVSGLISVFHCPEKDPKWSYAELDVLGDVKRVAEKDPISEWATTGFYYWRDGKQFIRNANSMIDADDRVNGEFYTCPVFNYTCAESRVVTLEVDRMQGIGTPEDLEEFLK